MHDEESKAIQIRTLFAPRFCSGREAPSSAAACQQPASRGQGRASPAITRLAQQQNRQQFDQDAAGENVATARWLCVACSGRCLSIATSATAAATGKCGSWRLLQPPPVRAH
jgi:hypothetical protein